MSQISHSISDQVLVRLKILLKIALVHECLSESFYLTGCGINITKRFVILHFIMPQAILFKHLKGFDNVFPTQYEAL